MRRRTHIAVAVSALALPFALAACSSSSSTGTSASPTSSATKSVAPTGPSATFTAPPTPGVEPLTVVVTPATVSAGQTAAVGASGAKSLAGKTAYVVLRDKELSAEIWAEGKPISPDGTVGFALTTLSRSYDFQVVVPATPLTTKEVPTGTKLTASSAVFPVTVIE